MSLHRSIPPSLLLGGSLLLLPALQCAPTTGEAGSPESPPTFTTESVVRECHPLPLPSTSPRARPATGGRGVLHILDPDRREIVELDPLALSSPRRHPLPLPGTGPVDPYQLAVGPGDTLLLADRMGAALWRLPPEGEWIRTPLPFPLHGVHPAGASLLLVSVGIHGGSSLHRLEESGPIPIGLPIPPNDDPSLALLGSILEGHSGPGEGAIFVHPFFHPLAHRIDEDGGTRTFPVPISADSTIWNKYRPGTNASPLETVTMEDVSSLPVPATAIIGLPKGEGYLLVAPAGPGRERALLRVDARFRILSAQSILPEPRHILLSPDGEDLWVVDRDGGWHGCGPAAPSLPGTEGSADKAVEGVRSGEEPRIRSLGAALELDSGWIVLDGASAQWHRLASDGTLLASHGGRGSGPGEMRDPVGLLRQGDTILVAERMGGTIHRYLGDGSPLRSLHLPAGGCTAPLLRDAAPDPEGRGIVLLRQCADPTALLHHRWERYVDGELELLHRRPNDGRSEPSGKEGLLRRAWVPVMAASPEGILVGDATDRCLLLLRSDPGHPPRRICHPSPRRRPLSATELSAMKRVRSLLPPGDPPPDHHPFFDRAFLLPRGTVAFRTLTDSEEAIRIDFVPPEGPPVRFPAILPPDSWVGTRSILTLRHHLDGGEVELLPLALPDR